MFLGKSEIFRNVVASPKGVAIYGLVFCAFLLAACSDIGERNNPTDPLAANYDPAILDPSLSSSSAVVVPTPASWNYLNPSVAYGEYVDARDSRVYRTASINGKIWLAENVNFAKAGKCYDDDSTLCDKYGRLYTWKEASTACPAGFHLPTGDEWNTLPSKAKSLMALKGWALDGGKTGGNDSLGFAVLPGGYYVSKALKNYSVGYYDLMDGAYFWTATKISSDSAYGRVVTSSSIWPNPSAQTLAYSVRCVGDSETKFVPTSSSFTAASSSSAKATSSSAKASSSSTKATSSSSAKGSSSSAISSGASSKKRVVQSDLPCGDLWCGPELDYSATTGFGNAGQEVGTWYYYLDDGSKGNSYFEFIKPVKEDNVGFEDIINECGGICGSAHFGSKYMYPYLGLAFFLLETPETMVDLSSWKGLCVSYSSSKSIYLGLHPSDSVQAVMEYDDFVASLPKSEGGTVDVPWSSFRQLGWGAEYDRDQLLKQVSSIVFIFKDMSAGTVVDFNIVSVGKLGTCTRF